MPSRKKRKSQPLPRPPWVPSPSPEEDWGTDNDPDREWPFRVVDQEVAWTTWKRPDGSNTTWHAANALNGVTLPTPEWRAEREEIIRNNSTTLQGCMENDRRFGYQPPTQKELKEWREREERDIAFAKSQLSTYNAAGTSRTANPPSPPRVNAEAGPSRIIPPLSSRPAPSSSRHTPTISSSRTPLSSGPAPSSLRFSAPTASSSRVTAIKPEVIVIDDSDDESDGFVEITGFDSTQKAESPVSTSLSGKGKQRAHSRPLPPPPLVSIPLPAQLLEIPRLKEDRARLRVQESGGGDETSLPSTILPPPDTWKHDLCDTCYPNPAKRPREDDAGASVGNEAEFQRKVKRARLGSGRSSVKLDYSPEPSQLRKGKGKATDKSLRLRIETEWSSAADKASRAASLVFINDIDDEEVPPSILGNGWEFLYLEDKYALPPSLSSVIGLGYHPATGIDCPEKYARSAYAKVILGPEAHARLADTKVLLVGAGGIGCELLKNIVLVGFGKITLLDLDTIDLSNLNRQFLFRKKDVKQSKALVAAQTAAPFNPNVQITPIHGNIKEPQYDVEWYKQFDIVLNALDNLEARRHVNKMCMAAQIPLVESGTAGYLGQVQPIIKDRTECFDCVPKPTPTTFPVCTIRSTPSQPIHCIVWSKTYLMGQLFGEDEDAVGELDEAEKQGENAQEIATLRKEALAFNAVREALRSPDASQAAKKVFEKVFNSDIRNLLSMADMWRSRAPPTPLDFDAILDDTFVLAREAPAAIQPNGHANGVLPKTNGTANAEASTSSAPAAGSGLKDQKQLSLKDNVLLFVSSTERLAKRLQSGEATISFDKDDDDTLDFVTATSNLRSAAYGIPGKTRWDVKEMAGNIIPAIATTNAIVSGLIVLQALHLLRKSYDKLRNVHIQAKASVPLSSIGLCPPSSSCGICRDTYTHIQCDPARTTLGEVVKGILGEDEREVSVYEDKRVLSDPDWDDNYGRTLESLNVTRGMFLNIVDEEGDFATISVGLCNLPANHPDASSLILPDPLPQPPRKVKKPPPLPETPLKISLKRRAPDDGDGQDIMDLEPTPKRPRFKAQDDGIKSPSKRKRLEDDGLVLLDGADDELDDAKDIIEVD
ncbi:Ubiquitin-like modifier activating enzyme 2 [Mycena kentingensis (nom. inval.)]|nr:Ubiquitin-like modifier activating enzyme 2 [Mycena kentingensis (nom. inval.)]